MQNKKSLSVVDATPALLQALQTLDYRFTVEQELDAAFDRPISASLRTVKAREKNYFNDPQQFADYLNSRDGAFFVALVDGEPAGYLVISRHWNGLALVEDIAIDRAFRRSGCATTLLTHGVGWAHEQQLAGVTLETQNTNVAACLLYEKLGFELGGIDRHLYRALHAHPAEVALFWYLWFKPHG
ncbi:GNAT family N-acetyltransferase [Mixta intestinalis]|uniref:dTDP-fucosamine acetyltransferase n=1 Tax=Mixta intestinalis TaxID=1615494 RepID=A0A6P1PUD7_9GAMM|nr:GNAT family N-acetyltransferase [Mixta intestinalis]QHM70086.1 dTDP-fucosamine acetyltransferase [Mixta intestinalis]